VSVLLYNLRDILKRVPLLVYLNAVWKARQLKNGLVRLRKYYAELAAASGVDYTEESALILARANMRRNSKRFGGDSPRLKIFWVGANIDQDRSGFLQALERLCEVTCFYNAKGEYGLWYKDANGRVQIYDPEIVSLNDRALVEQVKKTINAGGVDILIGQMWSNYISPEALLEIREMGVIVINVSMDDRLPENWGSRDGCRLGAVGLASVTDLVLTTTAEVCCWYAVEGCPAIFWPLASDPELFSPLNDVERDIDVLFVGNRYGIRARIVDYLIDHGIKVSCWGGGWPNGYVTADQCAALFKRARIILGVGTVGYCDDVYTLKLRDFDAPMSGALYVTHRNPDLNLLFKEGEEIACYKSKRECADVIQYYLSHPDERLMVACAGWRKAVGCHNWDRRIVQTFEKLGLI
jgi:spore maturation protein CgeB